jgi:rSAM/selenodomain-associated transferase 1
MGPKRLLVFVKAPRPGAVKTRLARSVGEAVAAEIYRRITERVLEETRDASGRWARVVCFDPPGARAELAAWLGADCALLPQQGTDLGKRMQHGFEAAFASGARRVVLAGSDIPGLSRALVVEAFAALEAHDVVLGPALDGGYYLIGLREQQAGLFDGMRWSQPDVFRDTLDRAAAAGLSVHRLPELRDIDSLEDVRAEWPRLRPLLVGSRALAPVTLALVRRS